MTQAVGLAGQPPDANHDPTVCSPEELAQIQAQLGIRLGDTKPELVDLIVDRSRQAGNEAFRQKNYRGAQAACTNRAREAQEPQLGCCHRQHGLGLAGGWGWLASLVPAARFAC